MSYLICEKCGGCYELEENESPEDFESCYCGGNLKYVKQLDSNENTNTNQYTPTKICPTCRNGNAKNSPICEFCGEKLDKIGDSMKTFDALKSIPQLIDGKAILSGFMAFTFIYIFNSLFDVISIFDNIIYLEALIGGVVAAYVSHPDYKSGILNGGLSSLIFGIIDSILALILVGNKVDFLFAMTYSIQYMVTSIIIPAIIGAFIGTTIKKRMMNSKVNQESNFLVCDTCRGYYKLSPAESPENFSDECECGGNLIYVSDFSINGKLTQKNKMKSNMKFHPVISIFSGFIVLFMFSSISAAVFGTGSELGNFLFLTSFVLGGFIATYFTEEKKVFYGVFLGLFSVTITVLLMLHYGKHLGSFNVFTVVNCIIMASIGGFIAKKMDYLKNKN